MRAAQAETSFAEVFHQLRGVLERHADSFETSSSAGGDYTLTAPTGAGKGAAFGAVLAKKGYVSYHLFAVYLYPDLLGGLSAGLRARMQGKSCFNFKRPLDDGQLSELARLTQSARDRYRAGLLGNRIT